MVATFFFAQNIFGNCGNISINGKKVVCRRKKKKLYLDRGFFNVSVIKWLKALDIVFTMPASRRGKHLVHASWILEKRSLPLQRYLAYFYRLVNNYIPSE